MLTHEIAQRTIEALSEPRYEIVPLDGVLDEVRFLPRSITVTVTCSPTRGLEPTLQLVEQIADLGFEAVPHLSARMVTGHDHLNEVVERLTRAGIRNIYVIGGDAETPHGPFPSAKSLLLALHERGNPFEQIGIAAYPEGHPLIDSDHLEQVLFDKEPMATYAITQMCFDPEAVVNWARQARSHGFSLPIYVGIPGVASRTHLFRTASRIGVGESVRFLSRHAGIVGRFLRPGHFEPDDLIDELSPALADPHLDIHGYHVYTFNQVRQTENWRQRRLAAAYWR